MKELKDYKPVIIGVDHGYGNIKTVSTVFPAGVELLQGEAITNNNILKYGDREYVIGESHLTYQGEKTKGNDYHILTLAAIARELDVRGYREANIILAVGLPLQWIGAQKKNFREYMLCDQEPVFTFRDKEYHILISKVFIFPQCLAETALISDLSGENMIVDIGNGTMNIARIENGTPYENSLKTETYGVSICVREIQSALSKKLGRNIAERRIEELLRNGCEGRTGDVPQTTDELARTYTTEIIRKLEVYGYDENVKLHVFGGGGCLLKHYSTLSQLPGVTFYDDICANAKGYEASARMKLEMQEKNRK
ncbi:plasmid segregation actin-type ATPase ParM [Butyrivibrio sp. INlla18]|uniref:ParM/StbA family protein n=1 Tax=Butyrivibrio sp. INlla18 TaxID=1520806 RepID=UPI00088B15FC|nr:ParM/StbA family protein [Butyrivibrio sp. INlla18]SDA79078.1 plasmid segregation actin-type ATPase ParM [Butyrivibrio sp. INlla18]